MTDNCHFLNREIKEKKSNKRESEKVVRARTWAVNTRLYAHTCVYTYTHDAHTHTDTHTHTYTHIHEVYVVRTQDNLAPMIFARGEMRKNILRHEREQSISNNG